MMKRSKGQEVKGLQNLFTFLPFYFFTFLFGCSGLGVIQERLAPKQLDGGKVSFRYYSPSAKTVTVAGDFNGWEYKQDQSRTIYMKKNEQDVWEATVPMSSGRYRYKFVLDYQSWILDSNNPLTEDDGTGNFNSLIVVR